MTFIKTTKTKGYTLLFAVIVSSIVLSIAAFIMSISRKQFILSSLARDSTVAIYAADSAIQCAVAAYANGTLVEYHTDEGQGNSNRPERYVLSCGSSGGNGNFGNNPTTEATVGFLTGTAYQSGEVSIIYDNNTCAKVVITDGFDSLKTTRHKVRIESRGYSIGNAGACPVRNPRTTERAIQLEYYD